MNSVMKYVKENGFFASPEYGDSLEGTGFSEEEYYFLTEKIIKKYEEDSIDVTKDFYTALFPFSYNQDKFVLLFCVGQGSFTTFSTENLYRERHTDLPSDAGFIEMTDFIDKLDLSSKDEFPKTDTFLTID